MLLEIGLKPAISSIAETIVGTTLSNDYFGLCQVSALFVKEDMDYIDNMYYSYSLARHLEERLRNIFETRQQRPAMFFVKENTEHALRQYLVKGNYTQISNLTYSISFQIETNRESYNCGYLDDHLNAYIDLPGTYSDAYSYMSGKHRFQSNCTILKKSEGLPSTGVKKSLCFPSCLNANIGRFSLCNRIYKYNPCMLISSFRIQNCSKQWI